ncbi:MAG: hypothetical protein NT005_06985 [Spirochaetes bacterium]|nr:hypothetical protein [Spirochaetota bacterium]
MVLAILILLAVEMGGLLVIYAVLRERVRRGTSDAAQSQELRDEVSRLVVELNQTTDRNIALVEDGIASLNEALARADKKIGLLRRESEKHDMGMQVYSRLAEGRGTVGQGATAAKGAGSAAAKGAGGDPSSARPGQTRAVPAEAESGEGVDAHEQVLRLARGGFAPSLIAARVGIPLGEVELIISLERRKGQS